MEIWQYILLVASVVAGGGLSLLLPKYRWQALLPILLSFSGAYLMGIVALELIPETFTNRAHPKGLGLYLLLGFLVQLLLEGLSKGVEHGHVHAHKNARAGYGLQVLLGLSLHAFLEGLPLNGIDAAHAGHEHAASEHLFFGILLHKLPAAFALGLLLRESGYSRSFNLACLAVFAAMSPLGAALSNLFHISDLWHHRIMALVIGSLLHISTTILFETDEGSHHRIGLRKFAIIALAIALAWMTVH